MKIRATKPPIVCFACLLFIVLIGCSAAHFRIPAIGQTQSAETALPVDADSKPAETDEAAAEAAELQTANGSIPPEIENALTAPSESSANTRPS